MMYIYADDILDNYVKIGKIEKKKKKKKKKKTPLRKFVESKNRDHPSHPLTGSRKPRSACASAYRIK